MKLLAIFAHPDDEGAIAGTLARYARNSTEVMLICATKGEQGEISDPALATAENLAEVRTAELQQACDIIGIRQLHFLGYRDSGMADTPPNEDSRALVQDVPEEEIGRLVRMIRRMKPDVVITFEPYGWYGHPDHQVVSKLATAAYEQTGDAAAYPAAGIPWQPQALFHAVLPVSKFQVMAEYAEANNLADGKFEPLDIQKEVEAQITHVLGVEDLFETKLAAMWAHRTQFGPDNWFRKLPPEITRQVWGDEYFIQVYPAPGDELRQHRSDDLFAVNEF
jgi:LmbE family N-acetylglucosaminyl deacetylase